MKLLQLTKKFPYPLKDGESIAVNNLARALNEKGWTLDLLSMNTSKHPVDIDEVRSSLGHYRNIFHQHIDNKVTLIGAISHLLRGRSYQVDRFIDERFKQKLVKVLQSEQYDVIQLESPYLAPYIPVIKEFSNGHISLRAHNVEHVIWERLAAHTGWGLKKWYLKKVAREIKSLEESFLTEYDSVITISEHDKKSFIKLGYKGDIISVPIGLDMKEYKLPTSFDDDITFSFIGTLDWMPNVQGLEWFLEKVWPLVVERNEHARFYIAGRNAGKSFRQLVEKTKNSFYLGEVEDAGTFLSQHPVMIVPLLSGSGIRVKILEGMAKGMLVITTSCGKEGIPARHNETLLLADQELKFASQISYALTHPQEVKKIRRNAHEFVKREYDMYKKGEELHLFYHQKLHTEKEKPQAIINFES